MALLESISPGWIVTAIAVIVGWLATAMAFAFRIGRFEGTIIKRIDGVEQASRENRSAIENAEKGLRFEIMEARESVNRRVDDVFREIVRTK